MIHDARQEGVSGAAQGKRGLLGGQASAFVGVRALTQPTKDESTSKKPLWSMTSRTAWMDSP